MYDTTRGRRRAFPIGGDRCRHHHRGPGERPGHPGQHHREGRGPGRARRGDVRAAVLALLGERPMHGYEMIQELDTRTGGVWKPSPGSVYPTLAMLEDEGLVRSQTVAGKKLFELTDAGAEAQASVEEAPWAAMVRDADPAQVQLREAVQTVFIAARQIAKIGTDEQKAKAVELITELRRALYLLLAG
jgi:DNA-binding PadR family transcriptional regulator